MRYKTAGDLRQAIHAKLRAAARKNAVPVERLYRQAAFERLLARLFKVPPLWNVKGGYAMELRFENARATKDIDLAVTEAQVARMKNANRDNYIHDYLNRVLLEDLGDFFSFRVTKKSVELSAPPYGGIRFHVRAMLGEKLFSEFNVDMTTDNVKVRPFEELTSRNLLAFAGLDCPVFPCINVAQHFAEKIHAYTYNYGKRTNTRVKDLIDLVLLVKSNDLDKDKVLDALHKTFTKRNTHKLPAALPSPPEQWTEKFADLAAECRLETTLEDAYQLVQNYYAELGVKT